MRIIAGEFRGRKLLPPANDATRPVTDRVKQSVFDILTPRLDGAIVYDCFAGTGSMGLESLSRGAERVVFFEAERTAAARLRQNAQTLGVQNRSIVVTADLFKWFRASEGQGQATLVFLDPPYRFLRERPEDLRQLSHQLAAHHLAPGATVVFRHDAADHLELPPLQCRDRREYGGMSVEFLARGA
jgi:16S rRNA (guanine966-N2)-methyltransferase